MTESRAYKISLEFLTKNPMGLEDTYVTHFNWILSAILIKMIHENKPESKFIELCANGDFDRAYYIADPINKQGLTLNIFQKFNNWVKPIMRSKKLKEILE